MISRRQAMTMNPHRFDQEISELLRTGHPPDRIAYTCTKPGCAGITYAPPGLTAVVCTSCGKIDLGTERALDCWRIFAEVALADKPSAPAPAPTSRRATSLPGAFGLAFGAGLVIAAIISLVRTLS
jgi:hypothetical protein